ncbi:MAG: phosphoribosyltransferase family protein, partial [Bacteroidota bacterium]
MQSSLEILNSRQITQKLNRIAYQIYESNYGEDQLFIAGVDGNGYLVAKRIYGILKKISDLKLFLGKISIDKKNPVQNEPKTDFDSEDFKGKSIVIVDDVLNSGKTLIYAVKVFLNQPIKKINT